MSDMTIIFEFELLDYIITWSRIPEFKCLEFNMKMLVPGLEFQNVSGWSRISESECLD